MEYKIVLLNAGSERITSENFYKKAVEGIPISIKGFEFLPMFAYQADGTFHPMVEEYEIYDWLIASTEFGLIVSDRGFKNIEQAYFEVSEKLNKKGIEHCLKAIKKKQA